MMLGSTTSVCAVFLGSIARSSVKELQSRWVFSKTSDSVQWCCELNADITMLTSNVTAEVHCLSFCLVLLVCSSEFSFLAAPASRLVRTVD